MTSKKVIVTGLAMIIMVYMTACGLTSSEPEPTDALVETEIEQDPDQNVILEDEKSEIDVKDKAKEAEEKANADSGSAPVENAYDAAYANQLAEEEAQTGNAGEAQDGNTGEAQTENTKTKTVTATMYAEGEVNVRREPDAGAEKLGKLKTGDEVAVYSVSEDGKWAGIKYGEQDAYVSMDYLSKEKPADPDMNTANNNASGANASNSTAKNNNVSGAHASNITNNNPSPTESVVNVDDEKDEQNVAADTDGKTEETDVSGEKAKFDAWAESMGMESGTYPSGVEATQPDLPSKEETRKYYEDRGIDYDSIILQ